MRLLNVMLQSMPGARGGRKTLRTFPQGYYVTEQHSAMVADRQMQPRPSTVRVAAAQRAAERCMPATMTGEEHYALMQHMPLVLHACGEALLPQPAAAHVGRAFAWLDQLCRMLKVVTAWTRRSLQALETAIAECVPARALRALAPDEADSGAGLCNTSNAGWACSPRVACGSQRCTPWRTWSSSR